MVFLPYIFQGSLRHFVKICCRAKFLSSLVEFQVEMEWYMDCHACRALQAVRAPIPLVVESQVCCQLHRGRLDL